MNIHKNARLTLKRRIDLVREIAIAPGKAMAIVELRRRCLTQARIASALAVSKSTVSRVLARAGLSRLSDLAPKDPIARCGHERPRDLLHLDTKKLGRIHRPGKRIPGSPSEACSGESRTRANDSSSAAIGLATGDFAPARPAPPERGRPCVAIRPPGRSRAPRPSGRRVAGSRTPAGCGD